MGRWQWKNITNSGEAKTARKSNMASQESIHPRVQNKDGLGTAKCRRGSAGLALACGSKFMPCPCPESVSSKQVSQVSAPAGFSLASNNRRPDGRWASRSRGDARIILPLLCKSGCLLGGHGLFAMVPAPNTALAALPGPLISAALKEIVPLC